MIEIMSETVIIDQERRRQFRLGVVLILFASLCWGLEPVLGRYAGREGTLSQTLVMRGMCAFLIPAIYIFTRRVSFSVTRFAMPAILFNGMVSGVVADLLLFAAISRVPVVNVSILSHLQPIVIVILGSILLKHERLHIWESSAIFLMLLAATVVTSGSMDNLVNLSVGSLGDLMILCATIFWASGSVFLKRRAGGVTGAMIALTRAAISTPFLMVFLLCSGDPFEFNRYQIAVGINDGVGAVLYYEALSRLKAAQVSALELTSTVFAVGFGYLFFGEGVTWFQVFGVVGICGGILMLSRSE